MTKPSVLVEACVETVDEVLAAEQGGAKRLELCANMDVGGTTPSAELFRAVRAAVQLPIAMMVRPRGGPFFYTAQEIESMRRDIDAAVALGTDYIVLGVLRDDNTVDVARARELVTRAGKTPVTFHMAFDEVPDQVVALDDLIGAGVSRVLTKGGTATALEGADRLAQLVDRAGEHIEILAGGTVRGNNVREIVERSRVREVHARCNTDPARIREIVDALA